MLVAALVVVVVVVVVVVLLKLILIFGISNLTTSTTPNFISRASDSKIIK